MSQLNQLQAERTKTEQMFLDHCIGHSCDDTCDEHKQLLAAHQKACKALTEELEKPALTRAPTILRCPTCGSSDYDGTYCLPCGAW